METDGETYPEVRLSNVQIRSNYEMTFKAWTYLELICQSHFHHNRILEVRTGLKRSLTEKSPDLALGTIWYYSLQHCPQGFVQSLLKYVQISASPLFLA